MLGARRAIQPNQRPAVVMLKRKQVIEQPADQTAHALVNRVQPNRLDVL